MDLNVGDITSKISSLGKEASPLTGAAGFMMGVTAKFANQNHTAGDMYYPFSTQGFIDTVGSVTGYKLSISGKSFGGTRVFNPGAVLNQGTFAYVGIKVAKALISNKYLTLLDHVASAPLLGYGVGRVFDDPIASSQSLTGFSNSAYPVANYSNTARNGMPVGMGSSWNASTG